MTHVTKLLQEVMFLKVKKKLYSLLQAYFPASLRATPNQQPGAPAPQRGAQLAPAVGLRGDRSATPTRFSRYSAL